MRLVLATIEGVDVPLGELADGRLFCTTGVLARTLGVTESNLFNVASNHEGEFEGLPLTEEMKIFLGRYREDFCISRMRADMRIWVEEDIVLFSMLARTPEARQFRKGFIRLLKGQIRREYSVF